MAYHPNCPRCGSDRTYYRRTTVPTRDGKRVQAGWWQCLNCWNKFAGATDEPGGVLPAGVTRAQLSFGAEAGYEG